jgi:hypothetical protein
METVWKELFRRRRNSANFMHAAVEKHESFRRKLRATDRANAKSLLTMGGRANQLHARRLERAADFAEWLDSYEQDAAHPLHGIDSRPDWAVLVQEMHARALLRAAHIFVRRSTVFTTAQIRGMKVFARRAAERLRRETETVRLLRLPETDIDELNRIADAIDWRSESIRKDPTESRSIQRFRGDDELRVYVRRLGAVSKDLFGSSLYRTLATITNVALDRRDITPSRVREILRNA